MLLVLVALLLLLTLAIAVRPRAHRSEWDDLASFDFRLADYLARSERPRS